MPGLASHAVGSWKAAGGIDIWLRDYLPNDVSGLRVLLYGYDTDLLKSDSRKSIEDMGKMLLESATAFRAGSQVRQEAGYAGLRLTSARLNGPSSLSGTAWEGFLLRRLVQPKVSISVYHCLS